MRKDIAFGGVTRVPGGALSSDGDLCAAVDVCNDGMGLEMLEKPTLLFTLKNEEDETNHLRYTEDLLCIHEPEGEDKHYITQLVVESTAGVQSAPSLRSDPEEPVDSGGDVEEEVGISAEYIVPGDEYWSPDTQDPPPTYEPFPDPDPYFEWEMRERFERDSDDGGTTITPPGGGGGGGGGDEPTTIPVGIYLCYWVKESGQYTRKKMVDITPYGRITAIQAMGNTLICNHEGGSTVVEETVEGDYPGQETTVTHVVTYPPELRYWLWKGDNTTTQGGLIVPDPKYIGLGSKPPMVNISFGLHSTFEWFPKKESTLKNNNTEYKNYGGVSMNATAYTDTLLVWYGLYRDESYAAPYEVAANSTDVRSYDTEYMGEITGNTPLLDHWQPTYSIEGKESPDGKTDLAGIKNTWTTMALGCYNKFIAEQTKDNKFVFPFYVRYAIELYDGSLIMHSDPILMIPNSRGPIFALDGEYGLNADLNDNDESYEKVMLRFQGRTYGFSSTLMHQIAKLSDADQTRLENWKDLIRGINIYVTPPIYNYNQGGQVLGWHSMSDMDPDNGVASPVNGGTKVWDRYYTISKVKNGAGWINQSNLGPVSLKKGFDTILPNDKKVFWPYNGGSAVTVDGSSYTFKLPNYCLTIPQKEDQDVYELHENAGQFYLLATIEYEHLIGKTSTGMNAEAEVDIKGKKLNTISNQDVMQDDNGSHDSLSAEVLYGYNRRLNMAKVSKIMHHPLLPSVMWAKDYTSFSGYNKSEYIIHIFAKNGQRIARLVTKESKVDCYRPQYFFYPNTDAYEAIIWHGSSIKYRLKLKESKVLNGAFWLAKFLDGNDSILENLLTDPRDDKNYPEENTIVDESNKIYTSETDNPFYVPFGNINIAGGGEVRALAAATQAMSQGQFGQHPMYTFTSEGVWAMTVGDNGGWATIQPVTRDVISEHTMPLSLDSTVVFLTERGLLQLAGSQIKVLSDVLQGADPLLLDTPNFGLHRLDDLCGATDSSGLLAVATSLATNKFPEQAWLAYDYDNARIYVTPQDGGGSWVYNLKSELWTQASTTLDRQIVSYPECEAQCGGKVVRISVDRAILGNLCDKGIVISRPIKLADMGLLKRWREIAVRGRFKPYSTAVQVALWGTRDWVDSALVASSTRNRLTRWSGSPYFGHSVALFLTRPGYALQVAGMDVEVDAEHDNKLR